MTVTDFKPLQELVYEMNLLQAKLQAVEQKKAALLDIESAIRAEMQHTQSQINRFQRLPNTSDH